MSILSVSNMTQGFGDRVIFNNISFNLLKGEHIGLVGANGVGKTTLLKSLVGLLKPINGEIELGLFQEIGYFEQEIKKDNDNLVIEELWNEFPKIYMEQLFKRILFIEK